ncbi:SpdA protein [Streptomyces sp. NPDC051662]|uniref:SpdA protein n=1 Tax=Streptomyces sp. NPDC051662 TaxID=3154750 RepID=UPI0034458E75
MLHDSAHGVTVGGGGLELGAGLDEPFLGGSEFGGYLVIGLAAESYRFLVRPALDHHLLQPFVVALEELIAPMVDLSVVGLLVALRFLALRGVSKSELRAGTRLLHLCGLLTLALNTAEPLLAGRYGRACLDTVAPLLLLGWGHVGHAFFAQFHNLTHPTPHLEATAATLAAEPVPDVAPSPQAALPTPVPDVVASPAEKLEPTPTPAAAPPAAVAKTARPVSGPVLSIALLNAARRIADTHRAEHGTPITAAHLGTRMGVALPVATTALAQL